MIRLGLAIALAGTATMSLAGVARAEQAESLKPSAGFCSAQASKSAGSVGRNGQLCTSGVIEDADPVIPRSTGLPAPDTDSVAGNTGQTDLQTALVNRSRGTQVAFELTGAYSRISVRIGGPGGFHTIAYSDAGVPVIDLAKSGIPADGIYEYEVKAATDERMPDAIRLNNGRGAVAPKPVYRTASISGSFIVIDGAIKALPDISEDQ